MPQTTWAQIEKLSGAYKRNPGTQTAAALNKCLGKAEKFIENLSSFFVRTHPVLQEASAVFCTAGEDAVFPEIPCEYAEEEKLFKISTVGVMNFYEDCQNAQKILGTAEGRGNGNFSVYRLNAYKAELRKLPGKLLMLLLLFQEKARVLEVNRTDYKRNSQKKEMEKVDLDYLNFIWAFRELENVYKRLNGSNLRSDFTFTWFEAEWTTGNK